MSEMFSAGTIQQIARQLHEPEWVTELRRKALARHQQLPWPHPSDDVWRRTDASLLDPTRGFSPAPAPLLQSVSLTESQLGALTRPLGDEQLLVRADGSWLTPPPFDSAPQARADVIIEELTQAAR